MKINQFNDHPWERRDSSDAADRYEQELDRRTDRQMKRGPADLLAEDDGYREWCETIEKQFEQWEDR